MASNPIQTAKENLKVLFDEARKSVSVEYWLGGRSIFIIPNQLINLQYETNRKLALEHKSPVKTLKKDSANSDGSRQEIWIHPISGKSMNRTTMQLIEDDETDTDGEFDDFNAKEVRQFIYSTWVHFDWT